MSDLDVRVADQPLQGVSNVSTLAGEYKRISFNATATRGALVLSFSSSIAKSDWSVNAIEIRNLVNPIPVTLSGGNQFEAGRELPYSLTVNVPQGTYEISSTIGRLVISDTDQRLNGAQISVGASGQITFQFSSDLAAQGEILISGLDGSTPYRIPVAFSYPILRRLDFNHSTNTVNATGYRSVLPTMLYDSTKGFGWSARAGSVDRTAAATTVVPQQLFQDKHTAAIPLYFMVASEAGKTYDLRFHLGDTQARDLEISINGGVFQRFVTAAGEYISPVLRTYATDKRIEIYIRGNAVKEWSVNGIEVLEVTGSQTVLGLQSAQNLLAGEAARINRTTTTSGQLLQPGTYWISSNIGLITNSSGLRLNQISIGSNGLLDLTVRSSIPGSGTIQLDSADGSIRYELPVEFNLNPVRLYDFDHVNRNVYSPSASGYTRVLATQVYSQALGFGWNSAVKSADRGTSARNMPTPSELNRDKHFNSVPGSFFAMSEAGKTYSVTVHFGDTEARNVEVSFMVEQLTIVSPRLQIVIRAELGMWLLQAIEFR